MSPDDLPHKFGFHLGQTELRNPEAHGKGCGGIKRYKDRHHVYQEVLVSFRPPFFPNPCQSFVVLVRGQHLRLDLLDDILVLHQVENLVSKLLKGSNVRRSLTGFILPN